MNNNCPPQGAHRSSSASTQQYTSIRQSAPAAPPHLQHSLMLHVDVHGCAWLQGTPVVCVGSHHVHKMKSKIKQQKTAIPTATNTHCNPRISIMAPLMLTSPKLGPTAPVKASLRNTCSAWRRTTVSNGSKTRAMLVWSPFGNTYVLWRFCVPVGTVVVHMSDTSLVVPEGLVLGNTRC